MPVQAQELTFEQQRELLLLQIGHEKSRCEMEMIRQQTERVKLEGYRQSRDEMRDDGRAHPFDIANLWLVPPFNEKEPDSFFVLFEHVSVARGWSDADCALLLQCVLRGKVQGAYSALSTADSASYVKIKSAVLKAYKLVPEAWVHPRFRAWEKRSGQTYAEFVRDLAAHFRRWLAALEITTFNELCELIVLEQCGNSLPGWIATYVNEQKAVSAAGVAVLAGEYMLLHKGAVRERTPGCEEVGRGGSNRGAAVAHPVCSGHPGPFKSDHGAQGNFNIS